MALPLPGLYTDRQNKKSTHIRKCFLLISDSLSSQAVSSQVNILDSGIFPENFTEEEYFALLLIGCSSLSLGTKRFTRVCASLSLLQTRFSAFKSSPRPISTSQLKWLPILHTWPIYLVVYKGPYQLSLDRTVSRRSEPSSRTTLMGEQPNPWDLLQPQDVMSRHRGAKPPRRYGLLGEISLLSPGQAPFCLYTLRAISIRAEGTFGRLRYSFGGDRPSQTAHLTLSGCYSKAPWGLSVQSRVTCIFTGTCVCGKQSLGPLLCHLLLLQPFHAFTFKVPLFPKLRGHFAEFLNEGFPAHLRILSPPTCVGLRYPTCLDANFHPRADLPSCVTPSLNRLLVEPLGFRWTGFSPVFSLLIPTFSLLTSPRILPVPLLPIPHPSPLSTALGTLADGLGCFPLDYGSYHSQSDSQARRRPFRLRLLVDIRFQVLFHSPPGVLFTFPSRYYALSVAKEYFALEGGPPCFPQGFSCLVVLWITAFLLCLSSTGLLPPAVYLSSSLAATSGISFDYFSSGYLDVSVPQVPSSCSKAWVTMHDHRRVSPFGYPRIKTCLQFPVAFRSLPRPSSALGA
ncbi:hypothetical protein Lal_00002525 [Lupinus albus]|nr:hypothetical protein Lal_00002525 [Lupinus albus]